MKQKFLTILLLLSIATVVFGQNNIRISGEITGGRYGRVVQVSLMQYTALALQPIGEAVVDADGTRFTFTLPDNIKAGVYSVQTNIMQNIDLIISGDEKEIEFTYNTLAVENECPLHFKKSEQNEAWSNYIFNTNQLLGKINTLKTKNLQENSVITKQIIAVLQAKYNKDYADFCKKYSDKWAGILEKNNPHRAEYYNIVNFAPSINVQNTYWDNINTTQPMLVNSNLYQNLISDYIMYYILKQPNDENILISATDIVMSHFGQNEATEVFAIKYLQALYLSVGKHNMVKYVVDKYFSRCPKCQMGESNNAGEAQLRRVSEGVKATAAGKPAPEIQIAKGVKLKQLPDDKVIVVFWNTTCSHCEKELPYMEKYLAESKNDFCVVGVCITTDKIKYEAVIKNLPHIKHVLDTGGWNGKYISSYYVTSTPTYFLLDKNRNFIGTFYSWSDVLKNAIRQ